MDTREAVRELRKHLGDSQQAFATRLGLSIRAVANYEKDRKPTGRALALLAYEASKAGLREIAFDFMTELGEELRLHEIKTGLLCGTAANDGIRGYLLVPIEGGLAFKYAEAFFTMFQSFISETGAVKRAAEKALRDLQAARELMWKK